MRGRAQKRLLTIGIGAAKIRSRKHLLKGSSLIRQGRHYGPHQPRLCRQRYVVKRDLYLRG